MERNRIFYNLASAGYTVAGSVATLPEGKKSDLLGPSGAGGADGTFLFAVQRGGGKIDPTLGVRLGPSKLVGYLDIRYSRLRHDANRIRPMLRSPLRRWLKTLSFGLSKPGSLVCRPWPGSDGSRDLTN